jgi:hypothetical protein
MFGVWGYVAAVALMAPGYQLFQAANNTAVMKDVSPDQRGVISGMLNLSRIPWATWRSGGRWPNTCGRRARFAARPSRSWW